MKSFSTLIAFILICSLPNLVSAAECKFKITANDSLQYDLKEIRIPKLCDDITVTLISGGKMALAVMGHNWVLAKTSDWDKIAKAEQTRFPKSPDDISKNKLIVAQTTYVGGAPGDPKEASVKIKKSSLKAMDYTFFCSFPAHSTLMNGKFVLEK